MEDTLEMNAKQLHVMALMPSLHLYATAKESVSAQIIAHVSKAISERAGEITQIEYIDRLLHGENWN